MRDFKNWFDSMRPSINGYDYYVNFEKIYNSVDDIKVELNIMNSLVGSNDIENEFRQLLDKYPEILKCIPTLLAVRQNEIYAQDSEGAFLYNFKKPNYEPEQYIIFMKKTGLLDMIQNHIINNLVDYALGIETGLDSNARKNRGGNQMEDLVETFIKSTGKEYYSQMDLSSVEKKWNIDLSAFSGDGTSTKVWDFVVKTNDMIYLLETNFYSSGGSKLNETARSYKMLAEESKQVDGAEFIWITDGGGWKSARRNLEETFNVLNHLYNISDMENGVLENLFI